MMVNLSLIVGHIWNEASQGVLFVLGNMLGCRCEMVMRGGVAAGIGRQITGVC